MTSVLGEVTAQFGGGRFLFKREDGSPLVDVGEFVDVAAAGELRTAIVDSFFGKQLSLGDSFEYSCTVIDQSPERDMLRCSVQLSSAETLGRLFAARNPDDLLIGEVAKRAEHIPVFVSGRRLIGAHSCFFGASGSGKSTLLKLVVEEILLRLTEVELIIFDPNSDFSRFNEPRSDSSINDDGNPCAKRTNDDITFRQERLRQVAAELIARPQLYLGRLQALDVTSSLGIDLVPAAELLWLRVWDDLQQQRKAINIASLRAGFANPSLTDETAKASAQVAVERLQNRRLWSFGPTDSISFLDGVAKRRLVQFDVARLSPRDRCLFTEAALKTIWERNVKEGARPTLIVIDEAHNLVPAVLESNDQERSRSWINRIAGEGRKYNLNLMIVSQRPAKIHASTLDNCRNFFVSRIPNSDDLAALQVRTPAVSSEVLNRVRTAAVHETLVYGDVSAPVFLRTGRRCVGK